MIPRRILILGEPGSGKNWLGTRLAKRLKVKFQDLDDFFFIRKFDKPRPKHLRAKLCAQASKKSSWVMVGVPFSWIGPAVRRSQQIIVLKEKFVVEAYRILKRSLINRLKRRTKESFVETFKLIKWNYDDFHTPNGADARTIRKIRRTYPKKSVELSSKKDVAAFLAKQNLDQGRSS
jgi:adenylate kinase family enzyme